MKRLENQARAYAWGSRTAIAALQGRPVPSPEPEAELWMGAHPSAPSLLADEGRSLLDAITHDPLPMLGPEVVERFGPRLPYLFKILAAEEPLSIQAHPNAEQARLGYAADLAKDPAERNYVDPYHKPELLVAVEEFDALCGFRDPAASAALLGELGVPDLAPVIEALRSGPPEVALRAAVELLLAWPEPKRPALVDAVAKAHPFAAELAARYPGDVGVVMALLLNRVRLRPDEAVFMPAGNLHAYLRGVGVEVMAASDNVLRGGLTRKRVDTAELARVLRYEVLADPVLRPVPVASGVVGWPTPVAEFSLVKAVVSTDPVTLPGGGPRIVLCLAGEAWLKTDDGEEHLARGESVFVAAGESPVVVRADHSVVFQASPDLGR